MRKLNLAYGSIYGCAGYLAAALDSAGATALTPALEADACHCINPEDEALPWALNLIKENT